MSLGSPHRRPAAPALDLSAPPWLEPSRTLTQEDFETLYDDYVDFVWRSAKRLGVADRHLEDVVQEVFLVVYKKLETFEGRSAVRTWLYGITLHVVRNHRRSKRRKPVNMSEEASIAIENAPISERERPDVAVERRQLRATLHRVLDELPDELREVLVMTEIENMSGPEIAAVTGIKTATVYGRLRTARTKFEAAMKRVGSAGRNR